MLRLAMPDRTDLTVDLTAESPAASPAASSYADHERPMLLLYDELRKLARSKLRNEQPGHTLQATALVHEAYLRLIDTPQVWESNGHFFAAAAIAMRRILIDRARQKRSGKYGGKFDRVELDQIAIGNECSDDYLLDLDDALRRLAEIDSQAFEIAQLRIFAGLTIREVSETLALPQTSVFREWSFARAWLKSQIGEVGPEE